MKEYLIWSFEHDAWWSPDKCGYTERINRAGRYSLDDAEAICKQANFGKNINEAMVPVQEDTP